MSPYKKESKEQELLTQVVASKLLALRKESGISTQEVSEQTGISIGAINNYERGKREPNFYSLYKLAEYFNVSADWLMGRSTARK